MLISPIFCKSNKVNLRTQRTKLAIILCLGPVPQIKSCHFLRHESLWFFSYFLFLLSLFVLSLGLQFHRSSLVVSAFTFTFFESSQLELLYAGDLTVSENWVLQKKRHRFIEQSFRLCGRRRGWDVSREQHRNMYTIKGETDHQPRLDA